MKQSSLLVSNKEIVRYFLTKFVKNDKKFVAKLLTLKVDKVEVKITSKA